MYGSILYQAHFYTQRQLAVEGQSIRKKVPWAPDFLSTALKGFLRCKVLRDRENPWLTITTEFSHHYSALIRCGFPAHLPARTSPSNTQSEFHPLFPLSGFHRLPSSDLESLSTQRKCPSFLSPHNLPSPGILHAGKLETSKVLHSREGPERRHREWKWNLTRTPEQGPLAVRICGDRRSLGLGIFSTDMKMSCGPTDCQHNAARGKY